MSAFGHHASQPHAPAGDAARRLVAQATGIASMAAGLIHISAAADHANLPVMQAGFLVVAVLQGGLGVWLLLGRNLSKLQLIGALGLMLGSVEMWMMSRTVGLPFLPGGHMEPIGFKDGVTVLFELASVPGLLLLMTRELAEVRLPSSRLASQVLGFLAAASFALFVPALMLGGGGHHSASQMGGHGGGRPSRVRRRWRRPSRVGWGEHGGSEHGGSKHAGGGGHGHASKGGDHHASGGKEHAGGGHGDGGHSDAGTTLAQNGGGHGSGGHHQSTGGSHGSGGHGGSDSSGGEGGGHAGGEQHGHGDSGDHGSTDHGPKGGAPQEGRRPRRREARPWLREGSWRPWLREGRRRPWLREGSRRPRLREGRG